MWWPIRALSERLGLHPIYLITLVAAGLIALALWAVPTLVSRAQTKRHRAVLMSEVQELSGEAALLARTNEARAVGFANAVPALGPIAAADPYSEDIDTVIAAACHADADGLSAALSRAAAEHAKLITDGQTASTDALLTEDELRVLEALRLGYRSMIEAQSRVMRTARGAYEGHEPSVAQLDTLALGACALADECLALELSTVIAHDAVILRVNALRALRSVRDAPPDESQLGATIDALILEQARARADLAAEAEGEGDPVLNMLRQHSNPEIRRGAFVKHWHDSADGIAAVLASHDSTAPRLRQAFMAEGLRDPRERLSVSDEPSSERPSLSSTGEMVADLPAPERESNVIFTPPPDHSSAVGPTPAPAMPRAMGTGAGASVPRGLSAAQ